MARTNVKAKSKTDLVALLGDLVKFPTLTTQHATNQAAFDWIKAQLEGLPLHFYDSESQGVPSLVITTQQTKHPKVLLMAHIDVAPAAVEAFELRREHGRLYGRGVFDMKFAVAAYVKLLLELGEDAAKYDVGVMLTADEETGGHNGTGYLVEQGWRTDVAINPDAIGSGGWDLEEVAKGVGRVRVESHGAAGHGSRPWLYRNAISQLTKFLADLERHFPTEPCGDPEHFHSTLSIGTIEGGAALNQIPDFAQAELDIRTVPGTSAMAVEQLLRQTAQRYDGLTLIFEVLPQPFTVDRENEYVRLAELILTKVTGKQPAFIVSHGGTDSRYFAELKTPHILTSPPGGGAHADDEWLDERGLEQFYKFVHDFVLQVAKK